MAWSSNATGAPNTAMIPSPVNCVTVLPYRCTTTAQRSDRSAMISRNRSAPTAAAISIECTTSANSTVTCLNSAGLWRWQSPHRTRYRTSTSAAARYRMQYMPIR